MTSHSNLWFEEISQPSTLNVSLPRETDVIIVGGGLAGLVTLYTLLKDTKLRVLLLEESQLGFHASGRNIGDFNLFHFQMMHNLDQKNTAEYIDVIHKNNASFVKLIQKHKISCEYNSGGLYLSANKVEADLMNMAHANLSKDYKKLIQPKLLSKSELFDLLNSNIFSNGLFLPSEFNIQPYQFLLELVKICDPTGEHILTNAMVESVTQTAEGLNVHVKSRGIVSTKNIVYANGSYCGKLIPGLSKQLNFYKYHVIATNPISGSFLSQFPTFNLNLNGIKIRRHRDRLLAQSMPSLVNEKYYDSDLNQRTHDTLKKVLKTVWPVLDVVGISNAWSFITCSAKDTKALIGEMPLRPREHMNMGHNINSVIIASNMIRDAITNQPIPEELSRMFNPGRSI